MEMTKFKPDINLQDYLTSTRNVNIVEPAMEDLSGQLQRIHRSYPEYSIDNMKASNIGYDDEQGRFCFSSFKPMVDREAQIREDKERFAKIFLGALLTTEMGAISDYTLLPTRDIGENIEQILTVLEDQGKPTSYFKQVFINKDWREYYHEHKERVANDKLTEQGNGKAGQTYHKALPGIAGHLIDRSSEKQAAFINTIFYPTMLLVLTIVAGILYKYFEFISK